MISVEVVSVKLLDFRYLLIIFDASWAFLYKFLLWRRSPLLPGDSELDQVHRIFSLLGCPSTRIWPDMATLDAFDPPSRGRRGLPDPEKITPYTLSLAKEQQRNPFSNLQAMFPSPGKIGGNGLDCLNSMLTFDPKQRITVR